MDYSLPQLFVLPSTNSIQTYAGVNWGSTVTPLPASQFGVYKPDYTAATATNVASQAYIQLVQARPSTLPGVDHKRTDKIYLKNVISWYKVPGSAGNIASLSGTTTSTSTTVTMVSTTGVDVGQIVTGTGIPTNTVVTSVTLNANIIISNAATISATNPLTFLHTQVTTFSSFNVRAEEDVTISLRVRSAYSDIGYYNGLSKSFTIKTPCGDCGDSPCDTLGASQVNGLVLDFVDLINNTNTNGNNPNFNNGVNTISPSNITANNISTFVIASASGTGLTTELVITAKQPAAEPTTADRTNFPFQYDRVYFWGFAYKGPYLSQDYITPDICDPFATVTNVQTSNYAIGSSAEVKQIEIDLNSYNTHPIAKKIFKNLNYNQGVQASEVVDGTTYDMYYLKYQKPGIEGNWNGVIAQDESAVIYNPTGQNVTTIAILTAFLGTPEDKSKQP